MLTPFQAGREDDFVGIENDTLPDFTQLEHFINSESDEQNKQVVFSLFLFFSYFTLHWIFVWMVGFACLFC